MTSETGSCNLCYLMIYPWHISCEPMGEWLDHASAKSRTIASVNISGVYWVLVKKKNMDEKPLLSCCLQKMWSFVHHQSGAEVSAQFGTSAEVSRAHFGTGTDLFRPLAKYIFCYNMPYRRKVSLITRYYYEKDHWFSYTHKNTLLTTSHSTHEQ